MGHSYIKAVWSDSRNCIFPYSTSYIIDYNFHATKRWRLTRQATETNAAVAQISYLHPVHMLQWLCFPTTAIHLSVNNTLKKPVVLEPKSNYYIQPQVPPGIVKELGFFNFLGLLTNLAFTELLFWEQTVLQCRFMILFYKRLSVWCGREDRLFHT